MRIYYDYVLVAFLFVILVSIQYSINKVIVLLKDIKSLLSQSRLKDRI
ncbi:hypothetical protein SAMN05661008_00167 [Alkalithermobacter thermoalcaliphilus JW-YL-7 = DSM 7308]|uniref:Uncharacterized protein n=1 Tax=Alkalithermobacter thermoalcaliphilus JW-YL-7 = DSM 7308 TaxID=1121328 RepID=A0A150FRQ9_CLOPD|nr:hypothetical protein JWYL7_1354 [[Clostridium] paradoxum JW-YL-7 = DSM 7308]SHK39885.1 hypothetical protein SAMN05661008_00167 [[Clostridium] paradoxum JW-YL-7 = DSM 7308]